MTDLLKALTTLHYPTDIVLNDLKVHNDITMNDVKLHNDNDPEKSDTSQRLLSTQILKCSTDSLQNDYQMA